MNEIIAIALILLAALVWIASIGIWALLSRSRFRGFRPDISPECRARCIEEIEAIVEGERRG